jgi:tRNA (guanine37-N1)-methyltransferase
MRIDLITAVPDLVSGPIGHSIVGRAQDKDAVSIHVHDLHEYGVGKHREIDDYPFGGGAGMVLKPEPLFDCIETVLDAAGSTPGDDGLEIIFLTPDGETFDQSGANRLSMKEHLVLLAGHYKGIDQRVRNALVTREVSIGDYVLSGGELPALVVVDAVVRLLPGVLGDTSSALTDSFQDGLLDAPVYTRPAEYRGMRVPEVLRSGNHQKIDAWRDQKRLERTRERRPDLLRRRAPESPGDADGGLGDGASGADETRHAEV